MFGRVATKRIEEQKVGRWTWNWVDVSFCAVRKKHAADSMRPAAMFNVYLGLGASFYTRNLIRAHCSIMGAARLKSEE